MALPSTYTVGPSQPQLAATPASPELFWICTTSSSSCLWPLPAGKTSNGLDEFLMDVAGAVGRVWILDPHFEGENGYSVLQPALDLAIEEARKARRRLDVRVLTGRLKELENWLKTKRVSADGVQRKGCANDFHDRYALLDGDLWHFGSTVGGGHPNLSCASRGWSQHVSDFTTLYAEWWSALR